MDENWLRAKCILELLSIYTNRKEFGAGASKIILSIFSSSCPAELYKIKQNSSLPTQWYQNLTFRELGDTVNVQKNGSPCVDKKYFTVWMWTPRDLLPPNSNHQPQERNHPGRKRFQCQKKPLRSLRAAVITCVQVYHETKIHVIVAVIMERRKAFVAQRWEENGCIQTELSISSRQTSLYSWLLKQALQLSGKL